MTQRNSNLSLLFSALLLLIGMLTFPACVQVEDDDDPTPMNEEVSFRVDMLKMKALDIKDSEETALEVYGIVNTKVIRGNVTEENLLWTTDAENYAAIGTSDVPLNGSVTYTLNDDQLASSTLEVIADLMEHDFGANNPDDNLGEEKIATPLSDITSTVTYDIVLDGSSGQHVQVTYSITRLP